MRKDVNELFAKAVQKNEIFDYLTGQNGYEIRLNEAYMPTDTITASFLIKKYLESNPSFNSHIINEQFLEIAKSSEWCWLILYYISAFKYNQLDFVEFSDYYKYIKINKDALEKNSGWICFNFGRKCPNLWEVVKYKNKTLIEEGYKLPKLE
ncbi:MULTISPECIES: hypothetical protein [Gilliamella]|uniref:Uncharacterized protein n=1 Tax=Gilliamella intestini TaxID=1798183 RepID=A0A1C4AQB0_9GAMM|nr:MULTISPECIES: hypothetical protein [Gilliamella]MWP50414.1 hypothetical protein [Gilliamella sp. Lep-s35]MWP70138.1 hypothetical protein [Gilliamella sp. Lep-s5]MWP78365.1 hypothetical protein [Gilliamella sp. Lep-s21]SCB96721.1 hypothetical protein GA0061080_101310 [Gilliamella intestini]